MSLPTLRLSRSVAGRVVHIRIVPRPINIAESREVFKLLSKFGELQYYKSQRYDIDPVHNGALVIFKDEKVAREVIQQSPIRFRMGLEQEKKETPKSPLEAGPVTSARVRTAAMNDLPKAPAQSPILPFEEPQDALPETSRLYQITANPAAVDPKMQVEMGAYHGSFTLKRDTVTYEDLSRRVPVKGMAAIEWRKRQIPMRDIEAERARDQYGAYPVVSLAKYYEEYLATKEEKEQQPG